MQSHFNISKYDGTSSIENLLINEKKVLIMRMQTTPYGLVVTKQDNGYDTEALEIIEPMILRIWVIREAPADGLQFTKAPGKTGQKESVGFTEDENSFTDAQERSSGWRMDHFLSMEASWPGMKENGINNGPFTFWYPDGTSKCLVNTKKELKTVNPPSFT